MKVRKEIIGLIKDQIPEEIKKELLESEIYFYIKYYLPIPKSFNKIDRELAELKYIRPITKPDTDNLTKTYMDALKGVIWIDDSQVVSSKEDKYYSKNPRVTINIGYRKNLLCNTFIRYKENTKKRIYINSIKKEIIRHKNQLNKFNNMLNRLTKEETINKYLKKIEEEKNNIKELKNKLEGEFK